MLKHSHQLKIKASQGVAAPALRGIFLLLDRHLNTSHQKAGNLPEVPQGEVSQAKNISKGPVVYNKGRQKWEITAFPNAAAKL